MENCRVCCCPERVCKTAGRRQLAHRMQKPPERSVHRPVRSHQGCDRSDVQTPSGVCDDLVGDQLSSNQCCGKFGGSRRGTNLVRPTTEPTSPAYTLPLRSTATPSPIAPIPPIPVGRSELCSGM